jgi:hypothetical protein
VRKLDGQKENWTEGKGKKLPVNCEKLIAKGRNLSRGKKSLSRLWKTA